nr:peptidoglycan DD-metalloendopeptidase family protein [Chloroflexota bacterium]
MKVWRIIHGGNSIRITRIVSVLILLAVGVITGVDASATQSGQTSKGPATSYSEDHSLTKAVEVAARDYLGGLGESVTNGFVVSNITKADHWAFGSVAAIAANVEDAAPNGMLFLAQYSAQGWRVAIEHTTPFLEWLASVPDTLIPPATKQFLAGSTNAPEGDGSAQLGLPWATGETWVLTGGPHRNDSSLNESWSSLDFGRAGNQGQVRAARDGIAYRDCNNFVRINHSDGWQTGYYHLSNIAVSHGQSVSRGTYLGDISTGVGCGGWASGPHQHFSLRFNGAKQSIIGRDIGGWTVENTSSEYSGCMIKNGNRQCASSGQLYNDGTVGSGGGGQDTTPPDGDYSAPSNGASITSRTVRMAAWASDNSSGVRWVRFNAKWNNEWRTVYEDSSSPYEFDWDLCNSGVPNGDIEISLHIQDNSSNNFYLHNKHANPHITKNYSCTQPTPGVPAHQGPANGSVFQEGQSITLSWNASANAQDYAAEFWGGPGGLIHSGKRTSTSWTLGSQWAGYTYGWHVEAYNNSGWSGWSNTWTFTVRPATPTNLSAQVASCSQINLAWEDRSGNEEGYKIYRNGSYVGQVGANTSSYQNSGLSANTGYSYQVRAYRGSIESDVSNTASATLGSCQTVTVDLLTIRDSVGVDKTAFSVGDAIVFGIEATNHTGSTQNSTWTWAVYDSAGTKIQGLSYDNWENTISAGWAGAGLTRSIPANLPAGTYRFVGTVQIGSQSGSKQMNFTVLQSPTIYKESLQQHSLANSNGTTWQPLASNQVN